MRVSPLFHAPWIRLLAVVWILFSLPHVVPAGFWLSVDDVAVTGIGPDGCPEMRVDRTIHRPFVGRWYVKIRKRHTTKPGYWSYLTNTNELDYSPGSVFPPRLTLKWWSELDAACDLPDGDYRVETLWVIKPVWQAEKKVRFTETHFSVP